MPMTKEQEQLVEDVFGKAWNSVLNLKLGELNACLPSVVDKPHPDVIFPTQISLQLSTMIDIDKGIIIQCIKNYIIEGIYLGIISDKKNVKEVLDAVDRNFRVLIKNQAILFIPPKDADKVIDTANVNEANTIIRRMTLANSDDNVRKISELKGAPKTPEVKPEAKLERRNTLILNGKYDVIVKNVKDVAELGIAMFNEYERQEKEIKKSKEKSPEAKSDQMKDELRNAVKDARKSIYVIKCIIFDEIIKNASGGKIDDKIFKQCRRANVLLNHCQEILDYKVKDNFNKIKIEKIIFLINTISKIANELPDQNKIKAEYAADQIIAHIKSLYEEVLDIEKDKFALGKLGANRSDYMKPIKAAIKDDKPFSPKKVAETNSKLL